MDGDSAVETVAMPLVVEDFNLRRVLKVVEAQLFLFRSAPESQGKTT